MTYIHATTLTDAKRFHAAVSQRLKDHAKVCRECSPLTETRNRYCPDGWQLAKEIALSKADITRLTSPADAGQRALF